MSKVNKVVKNGKASKPRAVPVDLLDPAVKSLKSEREIALGKSYGVDHFTTYEVESVRNRLAEKDPKLAGVPVDDLRNQIINRRKQGKYPSENFPRSNRKNGKPKEPPEWYKRYLQSVWWRSFRKSVLQFWGYRCALNAEHVDDLDAHHNRHADDKGSLHGRESLTDAICLCRKCHDKFHTDLPDIPVTEPEPID